MKVTVSKKCQKDIEAISDRKLAVQILNEIERLEQCTSLDGLPNLKRMKGASDYYRLRIGNYRLGFRQDGDATTLLRFMHRKEIYRYFP